MQSEQLNLQVTCTQMIGLCFPTVDCLLQSWHVELAENTIEVTLEKNSLFLVGTDVCVYNYAGTYKPFGITSQCDDRKR